VSLEDKIVLITGANSDIGIATALELIKSKVKGLVLVYHENRNKIDKILKYGCEFLVERVDVSNFEDVLKLKEKVYSKFGRVDCIIAFAGYPIRRDLWFSDPLNIENEDLDNVWNVDLKGSYNFIKAFAKDMKKQGYGKIVLTASTPALTGDKFGLPYTLAKASIIALVKSLAEVLAPEVCINAIALGNIATEPNLKNYSEKEVKEVSEKIPMKRFGKPEEVAKVVKFLISEESNYISGQVLVIDGGETRI